MANPSFHLLQGWQNFAIVICFLVMVNFNQFLYWEEYKKSWFFKMAYDPTGICKKVRRWFALRDLEQGKQTCSLKKLNQVLAQFNYEMHPCKINSHLPYSGPTQNIKYKDIDDPEKTRKDKDISFLNL